MVTIDLSTIAIPTPTAYDADEPLKNAEGLAYVVLQVLALMKSSGVKLTGSGELAESIFGFSTSVLAVAEMERDWEM